MALLELRLGERQPRIVGSKFDCTIVSCGNRG